MSPRIAREVRVKTEGFKFLRRNRALEEDEEFMARATAGKHHSVILRLDQSKRTAESTPQAKS